MTPMSALCIRVPAFRLGRQGRGRFGRSSSDYRRLCGRVGLAGSSMLQGGPSVRPAAFTRMGHRLRLPCPVECQLGDGDPRWEPRGHVGVTPGRARLTGSAAPPPPAAAGLTLLLLVPARLLLRRRHG